MRFKNIDYVSIYIQVVKINLYERSICNINFQN